MSTAQRQVTIRIPETINEIQRGFLLTALAHYFDAHKTADVQLRWSGAMARDGIHEPHVAVAAAQTNDTGEERLLQDRASRKAPFPPNQATPDSSKRAFKTMATFFQPSVNSHGSVYGIC